jgi:hypothetical protein
MMPSADPPHSPSDRELPVAPPAWRRLASAARAERRQASARKDDAAPFGFSTRVVALWRQARDEERRLALWQRLSWRAAFASLALCAMVAVAQRGGGADSELPLLQPPAIAFPGL